MQQTRTKICRLRGSGRPDSILKQSRGASARYPSVVQVARAARMSTSVLYDQTRREATDRYNRVNSKAMVKVPFDSLFPLVPRVLHQQLRSSRYAAQRSQSLVIQSDDSRKRANNVESCFEKLYQLLRGAANEAIPGETSPEQRDRVHKLYGYSPSFMCIS